MVKSESSIILSMFTKYEPLMEHDTDTDGETAVAWTVMGEDIQALDRIRSSLVENNNDNTKYQVTVKVLETSKGIVRQFMLFASDVSLR